tara:strand:- start:33 stop:371 length:339 start_codon:yes stop_codon:yes gene_type:complete
MNPRLTEPGTKYFLSETLKNCNIKKKSKNVFLLNLVLLIVFIIILIIYLAYKYKTKPNEKDKENKKMIKKNYILSKLRNIMEVSKIKNKEMITTLPKFESDYELLHEKFYNV